MKERGREKDEKIRIYTIINERAKERIEMCCKQRNNERMKIFKKRERKKKHHYFAKKGFSFYMSIFFFFLLFLPFFSIDRKIFSYRTRIITILYDYSYTRIYLLYSVWLIKIRIQIYLHIEILILFISRKRRGNKMHLS